MSGKPRELARLNPRQDERCRSAIQTTQLCRRLNAFVLGQPDPAGGNGRNRGPFEMSELQVRAALGLLRKTLPDLAMTQVETSGGGNHLHFHLEAAMRVSAQMHAEPRRVVTIEQEKQDVPASLLDAPLPEE
jgi:hypothetical protein